jgi:hypothetical protein
MKILLEVLRQALAPHGNDIEVVQEITHGYDDAGIVFITPKGWFQDQSPEPCVSVHTIYTAVSMNGTEYPVYVFHPPNEGDDRPVWVPADESEYNIAAFGHRTSISSSKKKGKVFYFTAPVTKQVSESLLSYFDKSPPNDNAIVEPVGEGFRMPNTK